MTKTFPVAEIFGPTIQGEGPCIGQSCFFIRLGGCDFRCTWCDSKHAVLPEAVKELPRMTVDQIVDSIEALADGASTDLVVISGGNPAIYDLTKLIQHLSIAGFKTQIETQGSVTQDWFPLVDMIVMSPKPPSSEVSIGHRAKLIGAARRAGTMEQVYEMTYQTSKLLNSNTFVKIVVFDEKDMAWAKSMGDRLGVSKLYLSVGTQPDDTTESLLKRYEHLQALVPTLGAKYSISILPQMHVLLWGHKLGV